MGNHALTGIDGLGVRKDSFTFDARKIIIENNFNPRSKEKLIENVARLKPQIDAAGGILQRISVRKDGDKVYLVDGESRLTAFRELLDEGKLTDPMLKVELLSGMADSVTRELYAITANEGMPLEKWEKGIRYSRLVNMGTSKETIAAKLGVSLRHVTEAITLADTPVELRDLMASGAVTTGAVMAEIKAVGPTQASANLSQAVITNGGAPIARSRAKSNLSLIAAVKDLLESAMQDADSPLWFTVNVMQIDNLREAYNEAIAK